MIRSVFGFLRYVFLEFGTLIVFWVVLYSAGIKAAIAATVAFILLDGAYRWWRQIPVTRIYLLTSALAVAFGCVDLLATNPFMIKYEAVITNIATGIFFVAGARGEKSLIQEVAERRNTLPDRADVRQFFRLFTLFWAAYFFVKAAVYLWLGMTAAARTRPGAAHCAGRGQPGLHVRHQFFPRPAALLPLSLFGALARGRDRCRNVVIQLISRSNSAGIL